MIYGKDGQLLKQNEAFQDKIQSNRSKVSTQNHSQRLHQRKKHTSNMPVSSAAARNHLSPLNHTGLRLRGSRNAANNNLLGTEKTELKTEKEASQGNSDNARVAKRKSAGLPEGLYLLNNIK